MKSQLFSRFLAGLTAFVAITALSAAIIFFIFPLPGQIPVLMYHFIGPKHEALSSGNVVTAETFKKQMSFLKNLGYRVISIKEYDDTLTGARKPRGREVVITFDDGNTTVPDFAVPILNEFNYPATLFLISENLKNGTYGSMKTDAALKLKQNPLIHLGAHSRTHPYLSQISTAEVEAEIKGSKDDLEAELGIPMLYFAYPNGDFDRRSMDIAEKAGYRMAFTTSPKKLKGLPAGKFSQPRVKISETAANPFVFWIKISGIYESFKMWRHQRNQKE